MPGLSQTFLFVPLWLWIIGVAVVILLTVVISRMLEFEGVNVTTTPPFFVFRFKPKSDQPAQHRPGANQLAARPSVDISRNKVFGDTRISVNRSDVRVDDNLLAGKTEIQVEDDQKKLRR